MRTSICLFLAVLTCVSVTVAQSKKDKVEIGIQSTSLTLFDPDAEFDHTRPGVGGRVTYNFNRSIAAEAEINYLPQTNCQFFCSDDDLIQAQFGVKLGKRFKKFGLFGKVRPGFLTVDEGFSVRDSVVVVDGVPGEWRVGKVAYPSLDMGGVVEFYISRRWMARFDIGDTVIRYGEVSTDSFSVREAILRRGVEFHHNLQVSSGFAFRF